MKHAREDYNHIQDESGRIRADEPVFLIRAQDSTAPQALRAYAIIAAAHGASTELTDSVQRHARAMEEWQRVNGKKTPDL